MLGDYGGCRKTPTTTLHCGSGSPGPCRRALPRRPNSGDENRRGEASRRLRQHRQHRSRADECPNPGGCFPPRIEMSWQPVLTALTALTMVARSPIPRAYPDRPGPRSTLAGERYFDAQHAKERLRTTNPAGEGAGIFWPYLQYRWRLLKPIREPGGHSGEVVKCQQITRRSSARAPRAPAPRTW
jgi:hypothetical protein